MQKSNYPSESKLLLLTCFGAFFALLFSVGVVRADSVISGSTTVKVSPGTVVYESGNLDIKGTGTLDNQGTLILKGNLTNENSGANDIGSGTVELSGTAKQTITGQNIVGTLVINNASGVDLAASSDTRVTTSLTLTSGLFTLGSSNLILGTSAVVSGSPTASNMVVATGSGELRKEFGAIGSFTYPVGDNDGTAEYTPASIVLSGGTLGTNPYVGVNLVDDKYPDDNIADSYITRYWNVTVNDITDPEFSPAFVYTDDDIVGTESEMFTMRVNPGLETFLPAVTANNELPGTDLTQFGTFTGGKGGVIAGITAFLEGPFNSSEMLNDLISYDMVPYTQPYNADPWFYEGLEEVTTFPVNAVDWVLLELRQADAPENADASTIFAKRAALILTDGTIVDVDGSSLKIYGGSLLPGNNLYVVVKHRNHLPVMAGLAVTKDVDGIYRYDFTDDGTKTFGYPNGIKPIGSYFVMVGGEGYQDGEINGFDFSFSWDPQFGQTGYYSGDFQLNGEVDGFDFSFVWDPNFAFISLITDGQSKGYHSMVP